MKQISIILLLICTVPFLFFLTACNAKSSETSSLSPDSSAATVTTAPLTDYSGLGLTDSEIQTLKEMGIANVDSAEVASKITGFKVVVPSFIPEGYTGGKFMVTLSGAGLPDNLKPKFNNTTVERIYNYQNNPGNIIDLIQKVYKFSQLNSEPTEICGRPAGRYFAPADPKSLIQGNFVTYNWEINGNYFLLSGWLGTTLDESTLVKMACSININQAQR